MKRAFLAIAMVAVLAAVAVSQTITVPTQAPGLISPTLDKVKIIPRGNPSAQDTYVTPAQITGVFGYYKSPANGSGQPLTGFTYTFTDNVTYASFTPAGTLAAGYFVMPPNPSDGQRACIFTTTQITGAYWAANTGQTIVNGLSNTTLSANTGACYTYGASNATWDRS